MSIRSLVTGIFRDIVGVAKPADDDVSGDSLSIDSKTSSESVREPAPDAAMAMVKDVSSDMALPAVQNTPVRGEAAGPGFYEGFYGLTGKPFSLLPDADFLYLSKRHRSAVNMLEYGMMTQAGFIVITGEVGAGKTTVLRRYLKNVGPDVAVGVITNASKGFGRLLTWVAMAFDIDHGTRDQVKLYNRFVEYLLARYAEGKRTVLMIDEAQNFKAETLEELRMLSNVNNEKDQLLQIVLAGQPELLDTLKRPELRQFVQRIAVHCHLEPLDPTETARYIRHRLGVVGGAPTLFEDTACAAIYYFTGGIPRLINLLCDLAMVYAFSDELPGIGLESVIDAVKDRNSSGLSPFKPVPDEMTAEDLGVEIVKIRDQIKA
jgi:type II secretory pathway predicted ATPase ExeA